MSQLLFAVSFMLMIVGLLRVEDTSKLVDSALKRAGANAAELRKAPEAQKEGARFLLAYMPDRNLKSLSADFLLNNVRGVYQA